FAKAERLNTRRRHPDSLIRSRVEDDMGRRRPRMTSRVEHPGRPDAIAPRASLDKGRLMNVAREHNVRAIASDPFAEHGISRMPATGPTRRRFVGRSMMPPDPPAGPPVRIGRKLGRHLFALQRAIPPWTHRDERILNRERVAIR